MIQASGQAKKIHKAAFERLVTFRFFYILRGKDGAFIPKSAIFNIKNSSGN